MKTEIITKTKSKKDIINELVEQGILDAIGNAISILDTDYKILYQNQSHKDLVGNHVGEFCYMAYQKKDHVCEGCHFAMSFKNGKVHTKEQFRTTDKEIRCYEITASPLNDPSGEIIAGVEIVRDITERKQLEDEILKAKINLKRKVEERTAELKRKNEKLKKFITERKKSEEALKEGKEYLEKLHNSIGEAIFTVKMPERVIEYVNSSVELVLGFKSAECIGKSTKIFYPDKESYLEFGKKIEKALQKNKNNLQTEQLLRKKNGEKIISAITTTFIKQNGRVSKVISIVRDITERKRTEEALREKDEKYRELFENESDAVMIFDAETLRFDDANMATFNLYGYTEEEFIKLTILDISAEKGKTKEAIERIKTGRFKSNRVPVHYHIKKDGTVFPVEISVGTFLSHGRKKIIGAIRDITERKQAEKMLRDSEFSLREQKKALVRKNIALMEMIEQINIEKNKLKEDIAINVENNIFPILSKLKLTEDSVKYRDLLKYNLEELASSFGRKITEKSHKLTPKEIEICNMVKGGLRSKEICNLLNISDLTVEKHRRNVRKKLGITKEKVNLASFLNTI